MSALFYDIAVIFSLMIMTLGMIGIVRMPDIYTKLHGAAKSVFLGVVTLALSTLVVADEAATVRIIIITLLVMVSTPISSHIIGHGAFILHERMETPGAIDESDTLVGEDGEIHEPTWRM